MRDGEVPGGPAGEGQQSRSHAEILRFFDGWDLLDPGLVHVPLWRPDDDDEVKDPERFLVFGGVGRRP
ncbi:SAM-dependent methyltransferase [Actinomadura physcomitrii]|uniref:SAM-dependent methyltransferase n=1 Tax=Actinomadura physcomitrii TaxID=2650748 RepID=UPI002E261F6F